MNNNQEDMYTEGFEDLDAPRQPRTLITNMSQQELDKLMRENEKLKKNLEKEKFFNNLLDKELKEAKAEVAAHSDADNYPHRQGVSRGAFYTLFVLFLGVTGFLAYTLYYNKQYNLFPATASAAGQTATDEGVDVDELTAQEGAGSMASANNPDDGNITDVSPVPPGTNNSPAASGETGRISDGGRGNSAPVKDSVPNIIGATRNQAAAAQGTRQEPTGSAQTRQQAQTAGSTTGNTPATNNNPNTSSSTQQNPTRSDVQQGNNRQAGNVQSENNTTTNKPPVNNQQPGNTTANRQPVNNGQTNGTAVNPQATNNGQGQTETGNVTNNIPPALPPSAATDNRPVIGKYKVTSKANFYGAPDENTLKNSFIRQSGDRIVNALEDQNGFIYVVYTNDLGYTTRGWLSKKDLTKVEE